MIVLTDFDINLFSSMILWFKWTSVLIHLTLSFIKKDEYDNGWLSNFDGKLNAFSGGEHVNAI